MIMDPDFFIDAFLWTLIALDAALAVFVVVLLVWG